ncbi:MAG: RDD family protein [Myxococcota bacterium]
MTPTTAVGTCQLHEDRNGTPCTRCGTFRCAECLTAGLCPLCRDAMGATGPKAEDTVGFGRRAGARIIDLVLHQAFALAGGVLAGIALVLLQASGAVRPGWESRLDGGFLFNMLVGTLASSTGAAVSVWICGASVGKLILGLRVVSMDRPRVPPGSALIRELAFLIDGFFFGLVAYNVMNGSPYNQRLGDQWGNTTVVRAETIPPAVAPGYGALVLGVGAGVVTHVLLLAVAFVVLAR